MSSVNARNLLEIFRRLAPVLTNQELIDIGQILLRATYRLEEAGEKNE